MRRIWRSRLVDHDGEAEGEGGIARWLKLTDGLGLDRDYVTSLRGLLPGTRFAVEAYVHFVREKSLLEAIASSLTELFSPVIISERMSGMLANYDFVTRETLAYFDKRPPQAQRDADFALDYVKQHATHAGRPAGRCWLRSNSSAACCGRCSTRCTSPMCRRGIFRPAPSCRRIMNDVPRIPRCEAAAAARRAAGP